MDRNGTLYFVSPRSFDEIRSTVYRTRWEASTASGVELAPGLSERKPRRAQFDVG